jgi:hypothetical protein
MSDFSVVRPADKCHITANPKQCDRTNRDRLDRAEGTPPQHLEALLQRYRDLTIYRDATDDDPIELDRSMDAIFAERGISAISATGTDIRHVEQLLTGCSAI